MFTDGYLRSANAPSAWGTLYTSRARGFSRSLVGVRVRVMTSSWRHLIHIADSSWVGIRTIVFGGRQSPRLEEVVATHTRHVIFVSRHATTRRAGSVCCHFPYIYEGNKRHRSMMVWQDKTGAPSSSSSRKDTVLYGKCCCTPRASIG